MYLRLLQERFLPVDLDPLVLDYKPRVTYRVILLVTLQLRLEPLYLQLDYLLLVLFLFLLIPLRISCPLSLLDLFDLLKCYLLIEFIALVLSLLYNIEGLGYGTALLGSGTYDLITRRGRGRTSLLLILLLFGGNFIDD